MVDFISVTDLDWLITDPICVKKNLSYTEHQAKSARFKWHLQPIKIRYLIMYCTSIQFVKGFRLMTGTTPTF